MPAEQYHVLHAKHNLDFLKSFYTSYKFNDWAITVSFYAVLHIVEYVISYGNISYQGNKINIRHSSQFVNAIRNLRQVPLPKNLLSISEHIARKYIVNENFEKIAEDYNTLYNNAQTARYQQYSVQKHVAFLLVEISLKNIVDWCNGKFHTKFTLP